MMLRKILGLQAAESSARTSHKSTYHVCSTSASELARTCVSTCSIPSRASNNSVFSEHKMLSRNTNGDLRHNNCQLTLCQAQVCTTERNLPGTVVQLVWCDSSLYHFMCGEVAVVLLQQANT